MSAAGPLRRNKQTLVGAARRSLRCQKRSFTDLSFVRPIRGQDDGPRSDQPSATHRTPSFVQGYLRRRCRGPLAMNFGRLPTDCMSRGSSPVSFTRTSRPLCPRRDSAHARSERLNSGLLDRPHGQGIQDRRTPEGHAEQAHERSARDDPGRARQRRRSRLSHRASQGEPEGLPGAPRQALAHASHPRRRRSGQGRAVGPRGGAPARLPAGSRSARAGL